IDSRVIYITLIKLITTYNRNNFFDIVGGYELNKSDINDSAIDAVCSMFLAAFFRICSKSV
ncbi:hypothetical protein, partial [Francisella tularensis]|uniref:hypothetical protein n=1 Tax=Francisella tularensis TaxID=263 RepID=UPI00117BA511